MCKIVTVANQKGGVAKTTTVRNLSYSLSKLGKRVLIVDFDPQGSLTIGCGIDAKKTPHTTGSLMLKMVLDEDIPRPDEFIQKADYADIIPGNKALTAAEMNMNNIPDSKRFLLDLLTPLRENYDYIFIDTNPSLGILTVNALTAAEEVIIPINPGLYDISGLSNLTETISKVKNNLNPQLQILGILFVRSIIRSKLYKTAFQTISKYFQNLNVFKSIIPQTVGIGDATNNFLPIAEYRKDNPAAVAYMELAKEVLQNAENQSKAEIA